MPAYARSQIVREDQVGVYHCIARCVRRAFLCGIDAYTGKDYSHRKAWILDRLCQLAALFGVEVCGYSVMSNHLHLVLRNRPDVVQRWSDAEIALRWCRLFPRRNRATGEPLEPDEPDVAMAMADRERRAELRQRLSSLSWFMRCLCEHIARTANAEDDVTGRFWGGRFKSVALLDEAAILACSMYVDLNPIRAGLAATPEESPYTSGYDRIQRLTECPDPSATAGEPRPAGTCGTGSDWLCELTLEEATIERQPATCDAVATPIADSAPTAGSSAAEPPAVQSPPLAPISQAAAQLATMRALPARASNQGFLPIELEHYVMLLDWTGRELRADKRGAIPDHLAPILDRLGLNRSNWVETVRGFGRMFKSAAGRSSTLVDAAARCSRRWFQGQSAARAAFV
jgi:REP element-mobilizing transposase RayT